MAENSLLWTSDGTGDGGTAGYTSAEMINIFRAFTQADNLGAVLPDYLNELEITGSSSPVSFDTGAAIVYGFPYYNDASGTLAVPTPSTATRIDRIALRADWTAQTVRATRLAGTEGVGSAPVLTQTANTTWDIPLAQVSITTGGVITVTDEREFANVVGDGGVTTVKINDSAVTTAKIADDAVTQAKMGSDTLRQLFMPLDLMPSVTSQSYHVVSTTTLSASGPVAWFVLDADKLPDGARVQYGVLGANGPGTASLKTTLVYYDSSFGTVDAQSGIDTDGTLFGASSPGWISGDIASSLRSGTAQYGLFLARDATGSGTPFIYRAFLYIDW